MLAPSKWLWSLCTDNRQISERTSLCRHLRARFAYISRARTCHSFIYSRCWQRGANGFRSYEHLPSHRYNKAATLCFA
ncbi:BPTI/Kunitz-type proteinase inhibitor domain-containing protein [Bacteroides thetaiotaomicron]|uniref:BPTI/Kunitz-type proteinase inhibitor domain-containing protein n=1 Tax=Bacteroides thetaiotaomicron TaxID=818 RepID=UPI0039C8A3D5